MVKDKREEMLKAGAIESIVTLLTKECETLNLINRKSKEASSKQNVTKRNNKQLIDGILKCILCISTVLSPESVVAV